MYWSSTEFADTDQMTHCRHGAYSPLNPQCKRVVELLYADAFPKHIDVYSRISVWQQAQGSKLGARNKDLIPTNRRIICTLRNLNFLMSYWLRSYALEATEEYGFREDENGVLGWAD
jgi:hypothetical protein